MKRPNKLTVIFKEEEYLPGVTDLRTLPAQWKKRRSQRADKLVDPPKEELLLCHTKYPVCITKKGDTFLYPLELSIVTV